MSEASDRAPVHGRPQHITVGRSVRVYPATDREGRGVVVEDFGEMAGYAVDIGGNHIADAVGAANCTEIRQSIRRVPERLRNLPTILRPDNYRRRKVVGETGLNTST